MRTVTRQVFEQKCREGVWDCEFEPNSFGRATVRSVATNRRFMVTVQEKEAGRCA